MIAWRPAIILVVGLILALFFDRHVSPGYRTLVYVVYMLVAWFAIGALSKRLKARRKGSTSSS